MGLFLIAAREARQAPATANPTRLTFAAAASLFMPVPLARAITLANVAGIVLRGATEALRGTLKTDALDARAIGLPTARGEFVTATVARLPLELAGYIETTTVQQSDELLRSLLLKPPDDVWIERDGRACARSFRRT